MKKIIVTTIFLFSLALSGVSVSGSQSVLIQNTTIMTVSDSGILENTDLLIENGLIAAIGKNLTPMMQK
jgi:imidazolonepropionase-like amidohydrolase